MIEILDETSDFLVLNKPAGICVHHPPINEYTIVDFLEDHLGFDLPARLYRPGIVHRLDRQTSGVMVTAKSDRGMDSLLEQFETRQVEKIYYALVSGVPSENEGRLDCRLKYSKKKWRSVVDDDGERAITDWSVVEELGIIALVRFRIHTGRRHQIRAHMEYLGHPILGDYRYGFKPLHGLKQIPFRFMLHSYRLSFKDPQTETRMSWIAKLPFDFAVFTTFSPLDDLPQGRAEVDS